MKHLLTRDFEQKGWTAVPYPSQLKDGVERAIANWKHFCELPESVKLNFPYGSDIGMGAGYELKRTPGANLDIKEDFHFAIGAKDRIFNVARSLQDETATAFTHSANALIDLMKPTILDFASQLETEFEMKDLHNEVAVSKPQWFLRFIHYFGGRQPGDEIATPHADKSGFTLHLYESDPGLECLTFKKQWRPMPVSTSEAIIIPGMRGQYRSDGRLKALYHRVVADKITADRGRFSIVCFVHFSNTPEYNKQKIGRLQEMQPGFNYEMPMEQFRKLFI